MARLLFVQAPLCLEAGGQFIFCERHVPPKKVTQKLIDNLMANCLVPSVILSLFIKNLNVIRVSVDVFQPYFEEKAKPAGMRPRSKLPFNVVVKPGWKKAPRGRGFFTILSRKNFL
jgi:hypothetical protein